MFYYQKAVGYESSKLWERIILALGTNHLNFAYESSGYETSVGTKRPDSFMMGLEVSVYGSFKSDIFVRKSFRIQLSDLSVI